MVLQGGRCAICRGLPRKNRLAVDHSHDESLAVRGLLCKRCNHDLLGAAHDSIELLKAAIEYLTNPPYSQLKGDQNDTGTVRIREDDRFDNRAIRSVHGELDRVEVASTPDPGEQERLSRQVGPGWLNDPEWDF